MESSSAKINQQSFNIIATAVFFMIVAAAAVLFFVVNTRAYEIHRDATQAFFQDQESPYSVNAYYIDTLDESGYYNPPHTLFLIAPLLVFGVKFLTFLNLLVILLLLVGIHQQWWMGLALALFLIISPQLLFVTAEGNIPGVTTGLGLLLLLTMRKGVPRGLAWALLATRPHAGLLVLVYDGLVAITQRGEKDQWSPDWVAIITGGILMSPSLIMLPEWISVIRVESPRVYTLSLVENIGILPTLFCLILLIGIRMIVREKDGWQRRSITDVPLYERFWLLIIGWNMFMPYLAFYQLWAYLLPIRYMKLRPIFILLMINFAIWVIFGRQFEDETFIAAFGSALLVAIMAPRHEVHTEIEVDMA